MSNGNIHELSLFHLLRTTKLNYSNSSNTILSSNPDMKQYQILGITKTEFNSISYETDSDQTILKDERGAFRQKSKPSTKYVIHITHKGEDREVHLSKYDCVTACGKICYVGMLKVERTEYTPNCKRKRMTHIPIHPLFISAKLEIKEYDYTDSLEVSVDGAPDVMVFQYSSIGENAYIPRGYVRVNMELFKENTK